MKLKFGIVLATAAAGLLVATPMAFAGDNHHGSSHHKKHDRDDDDDNDRGHHRKSGKDCGGDVNQVNTGRSRGLINISDVNVAVPVNACNNDVLSGVLGILSKDLTNNDR